MESNFYYNSGTTVLKTHWQQVLEAVDAVISDTATTTQKRVSVGDKSLQMMSLSQLIQLRDFCQRRIAEATGQPKPGDEKRIKYIWSLR